jgi:plasmid replication initiation protein
MTQDKNFKNRQFDLFVPYSSDLSFRDQRETMERPFFSLSKRKRLKPIDYTSPDGSIWIKIEGHQAYGMATIWDADILIWSTSMLTEMKERGLNDLPRTLHFHPHNLLKAIQRDVKGHVSGRRYELLRDALNRLKFTAITTNIRSNGKKKTRAFGWLDEWTEEIDEHSKDTRGMTLTLSDWVYEGIVTQGGILSVHPDYFLLTGGLERCLYRIARKHAGIQERGWQCNLSTLYEKMGSDSPIRNFKIALKKIILRNILPEYHLEWHEKTENEEPVIHMIRRSKLDVSHPAFKANTRKS